VIGYLIRIFWTVRQEFPAQRRRIFARAARVLRRTGDSVYLSPEGMRVTGGGVGHFNKGSFHLATSLRAPIVPLYIRIPPGTDPGRGYDAAPGVVDVYVLPPIDTSDWTVDEVPRRRDQVRSLYLRLHEAMRATGHLPSDLSLPALADLREEVAV
jgi:1-acyl-sn-glycerol-3-phosphate acyltransferase